MAILNSMRNKPEEVKIQVEKLKIEFKKFENFVSEINEEVDMSFKTNVEPVVEWLQEPCVAFWSFCAYGYCNNIWYGFYGYCNFNIKWRRKELMQRLAWLGEAL